MNDQKGFSLIELLIVVVIIGIVAAIAAPNLISARRSANESSAVSAIRVLHGANATFFSTVGNGRYAGTASTAGISPLNDLASANLIDSVLGSGEKSGYRFSGTWEPGVSGMPAQFYFSANPAITSGIMQTGARRFGVATDGVVRRDVTVANLGVPFDLTSLPLASPMD